MTRPINNVKHASSIYGISERRIRYLAQLRGIGTKVGGSLVFTGGDIKRLKPGKNGYPKGRPRKIVWQHIIKGDIKMNKELIEQIGEAIQHIAHEIRPSVGYALTREYANDLAERAILPLIEAEVKAERERVVSRLLTMVLSLEQNDNEWKPENAEVVQPDLTGK